MLRQRLSQKMIQKLSPQQIQLMKLLQVPTANLEQRIKEEMEANPALEEGSGNEEVDDPFATESEEFKNDESDDRSDEIDLSDYMTDDDDYSSYKTKGDSYSDEDDNKTIPIPVVETFHEDLIRQLGVTQLDDRKHEVALQIIGSIDDDGYIRRELDAIVDDLAFAQNISTTEEELEELLEVVQGFEPAGIGARSLQECLVLQLQRKEQSEDVKNAERILSDYFDEFAKKHYEKLQRHLKLGDEDFKAAIDEILKLNPKPGGSRGSDAKNNQYIIPDFTISNNGENWN